MAETKWTLVMEERRTFLHFTVRREGDEGKERGTVRRSSSSPAKLAHGRSISQSLTTPLGQARITAPVQNLGLGRSSDGGGAGQPTGRRSPEQVLMDSGMWSVGSRMHLAGTCTPCHFVHGRGCIAGAGCGRCHVPHTSARKGRQPSMTVRMACKRLADALADECGDDLERLVQVAAEVTQGSGNYMKNVVESMLRSLRGDALPGGASMPPI